MMGAAADLTGIYRRCGCLNPARRRCGNRCPRLADSAHGSWYFATQVTRQGRRMRVRRGGYASAHAARAARAAMIASAPTAQRWTVAQWLNAWLARTEKQVRPSTLAGYRCHVINDLIPHLGERLLHDLTPRHIEDMFTDIAGRRTRQGLPVSAATMHRIRATLRRALAIAVRDQLLAVNPAGLVTLPPVVRHRPQPWTAARVAQWRLTGERPVVAVWAPRQLAEFLLAVHADPLFGLWWLAAPRGLRRSEMCALRWVDVDLADATVTVRHQITHIDGRAYVASVKSPAGERTLALDSATVAVLTEHRRRAVSAMPVWWCPHTDMVFTQQSGRPIRPDWLTHRFRHLVTVCGLPPIRLHDLRHGAATLALAAHVDLKIVQDMLSHASLAFTADTYTAVLPDVAHDAAEATACLVVTAIRATHRHAA